MDQIKKALKLMNKMILSKENHSKTSLSILEDAEKEIDIFLHNKNKMCFSKALLELKLGNKVSRKNWNSKGLYVQSQFTTQTSKMTRPYLFISVPNGASKHFGDTAHPYCDLIPWFPSNTDIFSSDWFVIKDL